MLSQFWLPSLPPRVDKTTRNVQILFSHQPSQGGLRATVSASPPKVLAMLWDRQTTGIQKTTFLLARVLDDVQAAEDLARVSSCAMALPPLERLFESRTNLLDYIFWRTHKTVQDRGGNVTSMDIHAATRSKPLEHLTPQGKASPHICFLVSFSSTQKQRSKRQHDLSRAASCRRETMDLCRPSQVALTRSTYTRNRSAHDQHIITIFPLRYYRFPLQHCYELCFLCHRIITTSSGRGRPIH